MTVLMIWRHLSAYRLLRPITTACATPGRCAGGYSTGDVMPQNSMNYEGRRGGTHHNTCKAKDQFPRKGLVNGAVAHNGCQAASTTTSESTPAGTLNGTKPQCMVNGYINHGYKGKSTTAARPRTHGSTISAATDAPAAGRVHSASIPGGIPVNGTTRLDSAASLCNSKQMAPQPNLSATAKSQRRREKCRRRKRNPEVVYPENPPLSQMPPQEEEDWEGEIQEVTLTNWENICFGNRPYGPQDVIHFSLRDLTLKQRDTVDLPVTANYSPAIHHRLPVRWSCYGIPTQPGQFADADDNSRTHVHHHLHQHINT
ncbi:uncharacterized protein LOC115017576 isoform X2 [Cottoperca gobio]|uniref:Uncharacterized protein LOC115017576 isoform X2 n=1 Tax=Cottoperca gobio TaxID=56716 RepID=A0A6J2QWL2_COTGO|nr:uncharacterized protein LOC115017576 isoform X2 [Cottoperca gobio]XP_029302220.1 uncharacterized protein LOC115017576 isoform X2 [Cottoperca gobio]